MRVGGVVRQNHPGIIHSRIEQGGNRYQLSFTFRRRFALALDRNFAFTFNGGFALALDRCLSFAFNRWFALALDWRFPFAFYRNRYTSRKQNIGVGTDGAAQGIH
ncbi:MAG: hypothetical protein BWX80_03491 [Candidatus Hydrogenedentes bacterium ADurb.Bin101]|nr:MAG: hypothetical protein BWX80_03491 [Candidatus Hydrogenedentes bacterium ADurb.Bin101]